MSDAGNPVDDTDGGDVSELIGVLNAGTDAYAKIALDSANIKRVEKGLQPLTADQVNILTAGQPVAPVTSTPFVWQSILPWALGLGALYLLFGSDE